MHLKLLSLLAALLLVSACASQQEETAGTDAGGAAASGAGAAVTDTGVAPPAAGSAEGFLVNVGDRIFFDFDKSEIRTDAVATLERQAAWLQQFPQVTILIEGHADERGTREYNLALGERRANAHRDYLVGLGVAEGRIEITSYGKERPAVLGSNEAAWAQNRRGVVVIRGGSAS